MSDGRRPEPPEPPVPSTLLDPASEVGKTCHDIVERVRDGKLRVAEAFSQIGDALPDDLDDDERNSAMDSYFRILSKHDLSREAVSKRARPGVGDPEPRTEEDPEPAEEDEADPKRLRGTTEEFLAKAPWVVQQQLSGKKLNASLKATAEIVNHGTRNLSQVKASLIGPGKPPFPDSEWTAMLQGRSVNFDNVFSSLYGSLGDEKRTQLNPEFELVQKGTSTRKVSTFGEYRRYVEGLFVALGDTAAAQRRVIEFDKAVRFLVATRGDIELTDFNDLEFRRIETQYINAVGVGNGSITRGTNATSKPKPSQTSKSTEVCKRFNREEPHTNCRYRHVCDKCGASGTPVTKCSCSASKRA